MKLYSKGLVDDRRTEVPRDDEFGIQEDDDDLLSWSNNLDFDAYLDEWKQLGTSGPSNPTEYEKSVLESVQQRLAGHGSSFLSLGRADNEVLDGRFGADGL